MVRLINYMGWTGADINNIRIFGKNVIYIYIAFIITNKYAINKIKCVEVITIKKWVDDNPV